MTASAIESESFGIVSSAGSAGSILELACIELGRERSGKAALAHLLELVGHVLLQCVERGAAQTILFELGAKQNDGVARPPLVELPFGSISAGVAPRVPDIAIREGLDEGRPITGAHVHDGSRRGVAHLPDAHAVDGLCGNPHRLRPTANLTRG